MPLIDFVCDPVERNLFYAVLGQGAFKNGRRMEIPVPDHEERLLLRTDFSFRKHPLLEPTRAGRENIARQLGLSEADIRYRVGAVMNACGILESPNSCYFKYPRTGDSGGSLWDYAATACLFHEAGDVASDIERGLWH
jgi:3'(2'), 5'-bisphosphate nucleotidase/myo-inositol-1(or 4)-monophosphatase